MARNPGALIFTTLMLPIHLAAAKLATHLTTTPIGQALLPQLQQEEVLLPIIPFIIRFLEALIMQAVPFVTRAEVHAASSLTGGTLNSANKTILNTATNTIVIPRRVIAYLNEFQI